MPPVLRSRRYATLKNKLQFIFGLILLFLGLYIYSFVSAGLEPDSKGLVLQPVTWNAVRTQSDIRIAKATISYEERSNPTHEKALKSHNAHDEEWGYEMHVLRSRIVKGGLNKLLWLQHLIVEEMQKPLEKQVEWILYFNPTVILSNAHIPLHILLPPVRDVETFKDLSVITTKPDGEHLSTNTFFLRVSGSSLRILTETLAHVYSTPPQQWSSNDAIATSLQHILEQDMHRQKAIFQPASWYNSSTTSIFHQPYIATTMQRLSALKNSTIIDNVTQDVVNNNNMLDEDAAHSFWHSVAEARRVLNEAKDRGQTVERGEWRDLVREVGEWVELRAWEMGEVDWRVGMLREGLDM